MISKWKIPYKAGTPDYSRARANCLKFGKPWPELTAEEQAYRPEPKRPADPVENRDDLYFLADALKMAADRMEAITTELHELVTLIKREQQS